jgi:hypothetical protein
MATKVRKQIYIEERQERFLKRQAKAQGVSEAEVIRQAIDCSQRANAPRKLDPSAIDSFLEFARKRNEELGPRKTWRWNRDELYEDRLQRYDKRSS